MIKMIAFGDSIFAGWTGTNQAPDYKRIPEVIAKINNWLVDNEAIGGTTLGSGNNSFNNISSRFDCSRYQIALLHYGANDYVYDFDTEEVKNGLFRGINNIRKTNDQIKIMLVGPMLNMMKGANSTYDTANGSGMTQNAMNDTMQNVCSDLGVKFYDWRVHPVVTAENAYYKYGDGPTGEHPTSATSIEVGKILADKMNGGFLND